MTNIQSIDGASVVSNDGEQERLSKLKLEGRHLLTLYRSIPDRAVRASVLSVVRTISETGHFMVPRGDDEGHGRLPQIVTNDPPTSDQR